MQTSTAILNPVIAPELEGIAAEVREDTAMLRPALPPALIGDLLVMLTAPAVRFNTSGALEHYCYFLSEVSRGQRWQHLRRRVGTRTRSAHLEERRRVALWFVTSAFVGHLCELMQAEGGDVSLDDLGIAYNELTERSWDKSERLADDYAFVMCELARRALNPKFLNALLIRELAQLCLMTRWSDEEYEPRQLEIVHLQGDRDERLPGDLFGVRGVTVKTREDQIREILPSEFAALKHYPNGRHLVIDKIINRSPLIFEHFNTTRPLSRHRVLVVFVAGAARDPQALVIPELAAHVRARAAIFELLFAVARKVPRDQVHADIAVIVREDDGWNGAFFPLDVVPPRDQAWRNVLELDSILPTFFANFATHESKRHAVELLSSEPGAWVSRVLASGVYRCGFVAAFGRAAERAEFLPPAGTPLPRFDAETPLVLLGTVEDDASDFETEHPAHEPAPAGTASPEEHARRTAAESAAKRHDAIYRRAHTVTAATFHDLLSAHVAPLPLPETTLGDLSERLLAMVIGPQRDPRPVHAS